MRISWKTAAHLAILFAGQALAAAAGLMEVHAQPYPSKPIRFIVPFTPGGSNDVLARVVGQKLSEAWKQTVVVENKPGAGGNIGSEVAARSPADGYTFLIAADNILSINQSLYDKLPFDPQKDFAPITLLGTLPILLVVNPSLPANSINDVIALGKSSASELTYASGGNGTPQHLSGELLKSMAGLKMTHVPYKGNAPAVTDLLAGQVQMVLSPINSVLPHVKAGRLRALGVASNARLSYLPDVPTIAEAGVPGFYNEIWIALVAPAGTPREIIDKMQREVVAILGLADVREKLNAQGIEPAASSPDELRTRIGNEAARWARIIKEGGIRAE